MNLYQTYDEVPAAMPIDFSAFGVSNVEGTPEINLTIDWSSEEVRDAITIQFAKYHYSSYLEYNDGMFGLGAAAEGYDTIEGLFDDTRKRPGHLFHEDGTTPRTITVKKMLFTE